VRQSTGKEDRGLGEDERWEACCGQREACNPLQTERERDREVKRDRQASEGTLKILSRDVEAD
jgi:hypothetical protein